MANAPKTAFQTTARNFWTGLSWFRNARISSSNWRNKIFWINPYWMKLLSFARLSNIGNTTNFPPFDWGNDNPNILDTFWELNHHLLAVLLPLEIFGFFLPILGFIQARSWDLELCRLCLQVLSPLIRSIQRKLDETAYSLCSCIS